VVGNGIQIVKVDDFLFVSICLVSYKYEVHYVITKKNDQVVTSTRHIFMSKVVPGSHCFTKCAVIAVHSTEGCK
jgi:hypothetical protein